MIPVNNTSTSSAPILAAPVDFQSANDYRAQTSFGKIFVLDKVATKNLSKMQQFISSLKPDDRNLIYGMVYQCAGSPATSDLQWGEHHAFDNKTVFNSAITEALKLKYQQLTSSQQELAHNNIYRLAGEPDTPYSGSEWGRLCAMNNLPRLADAVAENKKVTMLRFGPLAYYGPNELRYTQNVQAFDRAFNRFQSHPVYQRLFKNKVFSSETEMRDFYKQSILKGTCKSQVTELNKISDANPTWTRRQLLSAMRTHAVFYNQIIMFTKNKIGEHLKTVVCNVDEKRQLGSMIDVLQVSEPYRELINSTNFSPSDKGEYSKVYDEFIRNLNSHKNDNNFHGMVSINNIAKSTTAGLECTNHAIFFQHLKQESVFRFYDLENGFSEYFTQDEFLCELQKLICDKYVKIADPTTTANFAVDSKESTYPCKSALGKLYQLTIQNKDQKEIEAAFSLLKRDEQCTIYGKVYQYAGEPTTRDRQWGEHHVFDNAETFKAAVTSGIIQRYEQSSPTKKVGIENEVVRLDPNYITHVPPDQWGRVYATRNLPRLADAIEATP